MTQSSLILLLQLSSSWWYFSLQLLHVRAQNLSEVLPLEEYTSTSLALNSLFASYWMGQVGSLNFPIPSPVFTTGLPPVNTFALKEAFLCGGELILYIEDVTGPLSGDLITSNGRLYLADTSPTVPSWISIVPTSVLWYGNASLPGEGVRNACCSRTGTLLMVSPLGELWGAGNNSWGQLGSIVSSFVPLRNPVQLKMRNTLFPTLPMQRIMVNPDNHIGCAAYYSLFHGRTDILTGTLPFVYVMGRNDGGQLGLGHSLPVAEPSPLTQVGAFQVLATKRPLLDGVVFVRTISFQIVAWVWGPNIDGEMCVGHQNPIPVPVMVPFAFGTIPIKVVRAPRHTLFILSTLLVDSHLYGCGYNDPSTRLLGVSMSGTYTNTTVANLGVLQQGVTFVDGSDSTTIVISKCSYSPYIWGDNTNGLFPGPPVVNVPTLLPGFVIPKRPTLVPLLLGDQSIVMAMVFPPAGLTPPVSSTLPLDTSGTTILVTQSFQPLLDWTETSRAVISGRWTVSLPTLFEVDPSGAVVTSVPLLNDSNVRWEPYASYFAFSGVKRTDFALYATLPNCAQIFILFSSVNTSVNYPFLSYNLSLTKEQLKITTYLLNWPYVSQNNSLHLQLRIESPYPVSSQFNQSGIFDYLLLSGPYWDMKVRILNRVAIFPSLLSMLISPPLDQPLRTRFSTPEPGVTFVGFTYPQGCFLCIADPELTVTATSELLTTELSPGVIAGIAAGAVLVAVIATILAVKAMQHHRQRRTEKMKVQFKKEALDNMRHEMEMMQSPYHKMN